MTTTVTSSGFWRDRVQASAIHFAISMAIAGLAAVLVFGVWYPYPYREISGGRELFLLIVSVDVVMGPLLTLAVFHRVKPWPVLRRDLIWISVLQLAALVYGLWTVVVARPVHLVFEVDRFRVVQAIEVPEVLPGDMATGLIALPWTGPTLLAIRPFKNAKEKEEIMFAELDGKPLYLRPEMWVSYKDAAPQVLKVAKPVAALKRRFADRAPEIDKLLAAAVQAGKECVYLPLMGRQEAWTVFLDPKTAEIIATMPLDSF